MSGIPIQIELADAGAGTHTTIPRSRIETFAMTTNPVEYRAGGILQRRGFMAELRARITDPALMSTLLTKMASNVVSDLTVRHLGAVKERKLKDARFLVTPVFSLDRDVRGVYIALGTSASADPNSMPTADWTDLKRATGDAAPQVEVPDNGNDGNGAPFFTHFVYNQTLILPEADVSDIAAFDGGATEVKVAQLMPNGRFRVLKKVYVHGMPTEEDGSAPRGLKLMISGAEKAITDIVTFTDGAGGAVTYPDSVAKGIQGFDLVARSFGYSLSDVVEDTIIT